MKAVMPFFAGVGIGYRKDDDDIAVLARRDELLGAIKIT
jgi:hypothetical protein